MDIADSSLISSNTGPATITELAAGRPEVATAVKARRATAAAYGAGFATLFLAIASDLTAEAMCGRGRRYWPACWSCRC